ncbi:esterase [Variovorax sp. LT2P21]|uniref:esterase n=1 Tax=Variovorax sp. LT2P21 TaxID=3443731 RepID=UPI003F479161
MSATSIIVQQPLSPASRLVLLTHGVGSVPQSMLELGRWFAKRDPEAMVVSVASPEPSDISAGYQWFSVRGVTEANRQARVDAAMPGFVACVQHWQGIAHVDPQRTLLAGFSQGAIMALESTKLTHAPALRIVAMAGRFATPPERKTSAVVHLLYGGVDPVMPQALGEAARAQLREFGDDVTLDVAPGIGHQPDPALLALLAARLAPT